MTTSNRKRSARGLSRRGFLQASAGVAAAAAVAPRALAQGASQPKRLLVIFTPDGTVHDAWRPTGSTTDFTLPTILKPFEPLQDRMMVLDGVRRITAGPGDAHQQGMTQMLTGRPNAGEARSTGISIDEFVHQHISDGRRALRLGVQAYKYRTDWTRMCFSEAGDPLDPQNSPYEARRTMFEGFTPNTNTGPSAAELRQAAIRRAAAGFAGKRLEVRESAAGAGDAERLRAHREALASVETDPVVSTPASSCSVSRVNAWPAGLDPYLEANYPDLLRMQTELMVDAFACDRARVGVLQCGYSASAVRHAWAIGPGIDASDDHHGLSHRSNGNTNAESDAKLIQIYTWFAQQIARMVLDMETRGLLDNTLVMWTSDLGSGKTHQPNDIPIVMFGGAGHLVPGRYHDFRTRSVAGSPGVSHSDVLTTVAQSMGIDVNKFGDPATCSGPLPGVT